MLSVQKNYPHIYEAAVRFSRRIQNEQVRDMFVKCSLNTLATTVQQTESDVYLITGDINAMWLRDSAAQVMQYLFARHVPADNGRGAAAVLLYHVRPVRQRV